MRVKQNGKTLYHIQNLEMGSDGYPFDTFIWCDHFPKKADLKSAYLAEYGGTDFENEQNLMDEFMTSSEVYAVYAEEAK